MAKGDNQSGKARAAKIKKLTQQQQQQAQRSAPATTGRPKGGIIRWPRPKSQ